jgi:hypothetical protein
MTIGRKRVVSIFAEYSGKINNENTNYGSRKAEGISNAVNTHYMYNVH